MSLVPTFKIGVWNAWILTLYPLLHPFVMMLIDKAMGSGDIFQKMENFAHNKVDKMKTEIAVLKVKSTIWGAAGGTFITMGSVGLGLFVWWLKG